MKYFWTILDAKTQLNEFQKNFFEQEIEVYNSVIVSSIQ
mgnify:CR=1 FL=1